MNKHGSTLKLLMGHIIKKTALSENRNSSVGIAEARDIFLLRRVQASSGAHSLSYQSVLRIINYELGAAV
jgi:hypothetical protein